MADLDRMQDDLGFVRRSITLAPSGGTPVVLLERRVTPAAAA